MRITISLVLFFFFQYATCQNINAFHDYRDYFYIFDDGKEICVEYLPVKELHIGDKCIAYVDHNDHLKIYYKEEVYDVTNVFDDYILTDNLCVYYFDNQLFVFDKGVEELVCINTKHYKCGDNLLAFFDERHKRFEIYYDREIHNVEDALGDNPIYNFKVADNIAAYIDNYNYLKVFYQGEVKEVIYVAGKIRYKVGGNLLAYIDYSDNAFYVFEEGEVIQLEPFVPSSFQLGDDFIAYVDHTGTFKYYKEMSKETILDYPPNSYKVKDDLIVLTDQNYFMVYYKNTLYTLENYVPKSFQYDHHAVAYKDVNGKLKLWKEGDAVIVSQENVKEYRLAGNTLYYQLGVNTRKVYYAK